MASDQWRLSYEMPASWFLSPLALSIMSMPLPPHQITPDRQPTSANVVFLFEPEPNEPGTHAQSESSTEARSSSSLASHLSSSPQLGLHHSARSHTIVKPWQVHAMSITSPSGMALALSSLSMLLAFFWVRICQLKNLLRCREQRIENLLAVDVLSPAIRPLKKDLPSRPSAQSAPEQVAHDPLKQSLSGAFARQELRVYYQPIVDLQTDRTVGFEALVRWQHPTLGLLMPQSFLPLAEEMDLIVSIDRWVLERACRQLLIWQSEGLYPSLSVNFSGAHLSRPDVADRVAALLSRYPIDPSQLTVEVTENVMISDLERAISTLKQLQNLGLRVSLDDFGTGYCSLAYLSQFPVNVLKIDRSFVSKLDHIASKGSADAEAVYTNEAIIRSILTLATDLGLQVVAEGIEYPAQRNWLQMQSCTYGQGNFFQGALTGEAAKALLIGASV